jgi:ERCC4-type nuclease
MPLPTIIIDSREQTPLAFTNLASETAGLLTADYSVKGMEDLIGIERKTIADLVASLTSGRARFSNELHRLRGYRFRRLLIIGHRSEIEQHRYRSRATPKAILASLHAVEARYDLPVIFSPDQSAAALTIERWAFWNWRVCHLSDKCPSNVSPQTLPRRCPVMHFEQMPQLLSELPSPKTKRSPPPMHCHI